MPIKYTPAIFRHRPFSLSTKILLSFSVISASIIGRLPDRVRMRIFWYFWNWADHTMECEYWFAMLRLSAPWAYKHITSTDIATDLEDLSTEVDLIC